MEKKWNDTLINNELWDQNFFNLNAIKIMLNLLHFLIVHSYKFVVLNGKFDSIVKRPAEKSRFL